MLKVFHILPMTYVNLLFFFDVHVCINVRPYREVCWLQTETDTLASSGSNKNILKIFLMFLYVSIHMFPQERYTKRYVVYVTKRMGWKSLCQAVFKKKDVVYLIEPPVCSMYVVYVYYHKDKPTTWKVQTTFYKFFF